MSRPPIRLVPAQPHPQGESQDYMRKIPWRWILLSILALSVVVGGYWYKEKQKADALRAQIIRVHAQELKEISEQYVALRDKLESWIVSSTSIKPKTHVDPRLNISDLRNGRGLYLRMRIAHAVAKDKIAKGVRKSSKDAILSCMGLEAFQVRDLYGKGEFLLPSWLDETRNSTDVMRLRVIDDELARRIRRDLPDLTEFIQADWFMLVIQQGATRKEEPVDVFLWDINSGVNLLSARVQAKGMLVPVRYLAKGVQPAKVLPPEALHGPGANDCSIAAQIKSITGSPVTTFQSEITEMPSESDSERSGI